MLSQQSIEIDLLDSIIKVISNEDEDGLITRRTVIDYLSRQIKLIKEEEPILLITKI